MMRINGCVLFCHTKPPNPQHSLMKNREEWLINLISKLRPWFSDNGYPLPSNIRVACGFPSRNALKGKTQRIGECWAKEASADQSFEILITPFLDDPIEVGAVLTHELCHTLFPHGTAHRKPFQQAAEAVGLLPPWKSRTAGSKLAEVLRTLTAKCGHYPHATLREGEKRTKTKRDNCRMLKLECPGCGYVIRTTRKWIETGTPTCPCGTEFQPEETEDAP